MAVKFPDGNLFFELRMEPDCPLFVIREVCGTQSRLKAPKPDLRESRKFFKKCQLQFRHEKWL